LIQFDYVFLQKEMEVIGKEIEVLNLATGEIYKGTIESFNIKLKKPISVDALGYDSIISHIQAPANNYRIIVDGPKDQKK
jgi:hypothetical protein